MQNRIKQIRKAEKLNQEEFGKRIGIKQSTITAYECGNRVPLDVTIAAICREFSVNEDWLRTGQGEMYSLDAVEKQTAELLGHAITHNTTAKDGFLRAIAATDEKTLQAVIDFMARVAEEIKAK